MREFPAAAETDLSERSWGDRARGRVKSQEKVFSWNGCRLRKPKAVCHLGEEPGESQLLLVVARSPPYYLFFGDTNNPHHPSLYRYLRYSFFPFLRHPKKSHLLTARGVSTIRSSMSGGTSNPQQRQRTVQASLT